jgi:hemoglobin/transferrin/lactoferrin receptor protein
MKHIFLGAALLLLGCFVHAQSVTVTDINTMAPLAKVKVRTATTEIGETDAKGQIDISAGKDADSVWFALAGYQTEAYSLRDLESKGFAIYLFQNAYSLEDVVVSASKFEEKRKDVAQQTEVIRAKDLAFQNQSTSADVMSQTGNILVQKSQMGGGSPIIRGFETNKVLMVVDGVRMNNAIYRGGHLQNILTLDNVTMDRVEILFGPGSTVYGSDALGGVMAFYTKNPILNTTSGLLVKSNVFARYGSAAGEASGHADVSLGTQKFGSLTSFTYSSFGDLRQGGNRNPFYGDWGKRTFYQQTFNGVDSMVVNPDSRVQVGSGYSQYDLMQKFTFQPNARVGHVLNIQFSNSSDVPRYDRLTTVGGNGNPSYAQWYYGPAKRLFAAYTANFKAEKGIFDTGRLILAYQNIEESRHDRRFGSNNFNHRTEKLNIISLNLDYAKRVGKQEIRYGLEGFFNDVKSSAERTHPNGDPAEPLDTRYPNGGSSMLSAALYATHSWEIVPGKFILNDGLRLSQVNLKAAWTDTTFFPFPFKDVSQSNLALNGNLGLVYMPGADWRFSLLGSTGFRAPNVDDLTKVFESVPGNVVVPNPGLKPERTFNFDLGISKTVAKQVTIGGNGWYTIYNNALTTGLGTFEGQDSILYDGQLSQVTTTTNAANAYLYGASLFLSIDFNEHFRWVNTFNYLRSHQNRYDRLSARPHRTFLRKEQPAIQHEKGSCRSFCLVQRMETPR